MEDEIIMEADFRLLLKCFFHNWPKKGWVEWWNLPNFPFSIIEIVEKKDKWQFFASEWQISIIVEDQIRLWRLYFCAWINRRGDTAIRYFRVHCTCNKYALCKNPQWSISNLLANGELEDYITIEGRRNLQEKTMGGLFWTICENDAHS